MAAEIKGIPGLNEVLKVGKSATSATPNNTVLEILNSLGNSIFTLGESPLSNGTFNLKTSSDTVVISFSAGGNSAINTDNECLMLGTSTSDSSCIFHMVSTTKGMGLPRMTSAQRNAISSPRVGSIVFDTDLQQICVYVTGKWQKVTQTDA